MGKASRSPVCNFLSTCRTARTGHANQNDTQVEFTTDQEGKFEVSDLPAGKGTSRSNIPMLNVWEQPTPQAIDVPSQGTDYGESETPGAAYRDRARAGCAASPAGRGDGSSACHQSGRQPQILTAVTGADGGYRLAAFPVGYKVSLLTLEKAGYRQPMSGTLTNADKDTIGDAVLGAALLNGTVVDAETGTPLPGRR